VVQVVEVPPPYKQALGQRRNELKRYVAVRYRDDHASIRTIAGQLGRSYGFVHRLLAEANVKMRSRGGSRQHGRRSP
jgi:transposase